MPAPKCHFSGDEAHLIGWSECVKCDWTDDHGTPHRREFHPDQLVHAGKNTVFGEDGEIVHDCWRPANDPQFPFKPQDKFLAVYSNTETL